jgi:uncharacterized membrane protein
MNATDTGVRRRATGHTGSFPVERLIDPARAAFAVSLAFLGVLHVVFGENLARMLPAWPDGLPARPVWAHAAGVLIAVVAGALLLRRDARGVGVALGAILLVPVLALHIPRALPTGQFGDAWLNVLKWLAMAAGPVVVVSFAPPAQELSRRDRLVQAVTRATPWLLGAFMLGSAILHVRFAGFVAQLMQPWMPWRLFWTYFAAVALAAGAFGLIIPRTARLAGLLTSLMILSWFFLVHTPRMLVDPAGPVGWSEMAESLAFSAMALLLAARAGPGHLRGRGEAVDPARETIPAG